MPYGADFCPVFFFKLNILLYFRMLSRIILGALLSFYSKSYTYLQGIWKMYKDI